MKINHYPNPGIPASRLAEIRKYLNLEHSQSLGNAWGHKIWWYKLGYLDGVVECENFDAVRRTVAERGETTIHETYFESRTGRKLHLNTIDPGKITLEIENGSLTDAMMSRVEELMALTPYIRRVFITHGAPPTWREVRDFIEKECNPKLETVELASRPSKGFTIIEKLEHYAVHCSYAVIVMTGDDIADDEIRARENVIHEIGFFQGRYGRSRLYLLHEEGVKIPSNLSGIVYSDFPRGRINAAFIELQREIQAAFPMR